MCCGLAHNAYINSEFVANSLSAWVSYIYLASWILMENLATTGPNGLCQWMAGTKNSNCPFTGVNALEFTTVHTWPHSPPGPWSHVGWEALIYGTLSFCLEVQKRRLTRSRVNNLLETNRGWGAEPDRLCHRAFTSVQVIAMVKLLIRLGVLSSAQMTSQKQTSSKLPR